MLFNIRLLAVCLLVAASFSSCTDHRLGGIASPTNLRLRAVQSTVQNSTDNYTYTYSYDSQNRVIKIDRLRGGVAGQSLISYGDPQRINVDPNGSSAYTFYIDYPNTTNPSNVTVTRFPLTLDGTNFTAQKFSAFLNSGPSPKLVLNIQNLLLSYYHTFDAAKHISSVQTAGPSNPGDFNYYKYTFTGENITSQDFSTAGGHGTKGTTTYTHDTNANPFFGLTDPAIDMLQRFSRNNVVNTSTIPISLSPYIDMTYTYEYNAQGLPTKRTATYNGVVKETQVYTYESY